MGSATAMPESTLRKEMEFERAFALAGGLLLAGPDYDVRDPATTAVRGPGFALLPLPRFIELVLASGMSAPHRLHDLAVVLDLVRSAGLPAELADDLHPWVRDKFKELWNTAQGEDPY